MIQRPAAVALSICEKVIVEEKTQNITLVNCLWRLGVQEVPSEPQRFIVYVWLTDGIGEGNIRVELLHPDTLEEILTWERRLTFSNPLQVFRAAFHGEVSFPVEGRYQVSLLVDGASIAQRTFDVYIDKETP